MGYGIGWETRLHLSCSYCIVGLVDRILPRSIPSTQGGAGRRRHTAASAWLVQCGVFDLVLLPSLCNAWWEEGLAVSFEVFACSRRGGVQWVCPEGGAFFPTLWLARQSLIWFLHLLLLCVSGSRLLALVSRPRNRGDKTKPNQGISPPYCSLKVQVLSQSASSSPHSLLIVALYIRFRMFSCN